MCVHLCVCVSDFCFPLFLLKTVFYVMYECLYALHLAYAKLLETRRVHRILSNWSYRLLGAVCCGCWEPNPGTLQEPYVTFNCWAFCLVSPPPLLFISFSFASLPLFPSFLYLNFSWVFLLGLLLILSLGEVHGILFQQCTHESFSSFTLRWNVDEAKRNDILCTYLVI